MSTLITCLDLHKSYGARTLLGGVSLTVSEGDRIGIIGPNGAGKTTLLRLLAGEDSPDSGEVVRRKGLRLAHVPQESRFDPERSVLEIATRAARIDDPDWVEEESEHQVRASIALGRMGFANPDQPAGELSGGWQKRLALAAALANDPTLLLLDEPTNHLDLEGILALEQLLTSSRLAYVVISHDRAFLERAANRVLEVAPHYPGGFFTAAGGYSDFLRQRGQYLDGRAQYRESLANRVHRELEWLSRGPKARTSKARARIAEAERLQDELAELKAETPGPAAGIEILGSGRKTRRLLVARELGKSLGGTCLLSGLDLILQPGQRLGVVGANGSGKSTLLRLLAGAIEPDQGWLQRAHELRTVSFDQHREHLDPTTTLRRALASGSDTVLYRDRPVHVVGWAKRFQFQPDQLDLPLSELSGGEHARVHIARLMLQPADLLLLDEPTNDLDIPTLEVLEEGLVDFPGALVIVTHDRMLLDRVTTLLLGLDGQGGATFFADVAQWQESLTAPQRSRRSGDGGARRKPPKRQGLTYNEKRELAGMEDAILEAETELSAAHERLLDPAVASDAERAHEAFLAHHQAQERVDTLYQRWSELDDKNQQR